MRLAWTAIVPRSMVEGLDVTALAPNDRYVLAIAPHTDPALRIVRCYRLALASATAPGAETAPADRVPAA